ncbi:V-type ATP synthase subunit F [Sinisalibacter aestuarii]|uniref:Vacuolar H+transporting two-sector ATPase F subunit n=1 Tax=Sinisalibacter aestuarii TaxID=2949426 RepID=A0ABQ5LUT9_9RHOB|nr:V-type ATP synthase subunit F [Sinisalibacter aestuarii]GKY88754.1 hypothetical protein STA1M1_26230 [Sinisalibacter aestuarii]
MRDVIFIGDAVTAAGFRLAGVPSYVPEEGALDALVGELARDAMVLMMTAETLAALPGPVAQALETGDDPLLAIVPDARGSIAVPDIETEVRRALGIEV